MRALDLFCGAGGASMGLHNAGFEVTGIDKYPQPEYPFEFVRGDAGTLPIRLGSFDFIWASPTCQGHTWSTRRGREVRWPNQIPKIREIIRASGLPGVIENVPRAPLRRDLVLSGGMFDKNLHRVRIFELHGFRAEQPKHRKPREPLCTVAGHGGNSRTFRLQDWKDAMGIQWMSKERLTQAIPPYYSEYIAGEFLRTGAV